MEIEEKDKKMVVVGTIIKEAQFYYFVNMEEKITKEEEEFLIHDGRRVIGAYQPGLGTLSIKQMELRKRGDQMTLLPHDQIGAALETGKKYNLLAPYSAIERLQSAQS